MYRCVRDFGTLGEARELALAWLFNVSLCAAARAWTVIGTQRIFEEA